MSEDCLTVKLLHGHYMMYSMWRGVKVV